MKMKNNTNKQCTSNKVTNMNNYKNSIIPTKQFVSLKLIEKKRKKRKIETRKLLDYICNVMLRLIQNL